ncbi:hypothetical protein ACFL1I_05190 [Candidatus Omnitrophota bacterium]
MKNHKVLSVVLTVNLFIGAGFCFAYQLPGDWNEFQSEHFLIYSHPSISSKYFRQLAHKSEQRFRSLTGELGLTKFDLRVNMEKVSIFVYQDKQDYLKKTGRPRSEMLTRFEPRGFMETFYFDKNFFEAGFSYELSQILLREFIGQNDSVPFWFKRGIGLASQKSDNLRYQLLIKGLAAKEGYLGVTELESFGSSGDYYSEKASALSTALVLFLLENYGSSEFGLFLRQLREGRQFYAAMNTVYNIQSAQELNYNFLVYLGNTSYQDFVVAN